MTIEVGVSGGGTFKSRFASAQITVNTGGGAVSETITPPAGERVLLQYLDGSTGSVPSMTVTVGGVSVITAQTLASAASATAGTFIIGDLTGAQTSISALGIVPLLGGVDEVIEITAPATASIFDYAYLTGVIE